MSQPAALVCTSTDEPWGVLLKVAGPASTDQLRDLQIMVNKTVARRVKLVVVDLSELTFISSLAMGLFVSLRRDLGRWGGQTRLAAVPPLIHQAFDLARLTQILPIDATVEAAVAAGQTPA